MLVRFQVSDLKIMRPKNHLILCTTQVIIMGLPEEKTYPIKGREKKIN
jgi:hypothetical protein